MMQGMQYAQCRHCLKESLARYQRAALSPYTNLYGSPSTINCVDGQDGLCSSHRQLRQAQEKMISSIVQDAADLTYGPCTDEPDQIHVTRDELLAILRRHILGESD